MRHVPTSFARAVFPIAAAVGLAGLCSAPARAYDLTPPALKSIKTTGSVNALKSDQFVTVTLDMTDDLSGIRHYLIKYVSPSGKQQVLREKYVATPLVSLTPVLEVGATSYGDQAFGRYAEPGIWQASVLAIEDADNNGVVYDADQLRAFGNTAFKVMNTGGYDIEPPTLQSGAIDTPTLSLSTAPEGTRPGTLPYASMHMLISDTGNGAVSGMQYAYVMFCWQDTYIDCGASFVLEGTTNHSEVLNTTLAAGAQMQRQQYPGQYVVTWMMLRDNAGNESSYINSGYGGDTDFSKFFPEGATIQVSP